MSLSSEGGTGMVMPVSPMAGGGYYPYPVSNNNDNGFGGDGW